MQAFTPAISHQFCERGRGLNSDVIDVTREGLPGIITQPVATTPGTFLESTEVALHNLERNLFDNNDSR